MTRTKKPKSICMEAFPEQFKKLRPENSRAGGVKARSQSEAVRMAVYVPIAQLFKAAFPECQCCPLVRPKLGFVYATDDIHHTRGREGYLLLDTRYWRTACRGCHNWINDHPFQAEKLGLIIKRA